MGVETGVLLDEAALFTNAPTGDRYTWKSGNSSSDRQFVIVTICLHVIVDNSLAFDNHMKVDVYRADIGTNGVADKSWTRVDYNRDFNDESNTYCANIDRTAAGADVNLGTHPFAIAWKFVMRPYGDDGFFPLYDDKSRFNLYAGAPGLQKTGLSSIHASLVDYETYYQGKQLLILKGGFRVAYKGGYKNDSPRNYVSFRAGKEIKEGDTVVFKP